MYGQYSSNARPALSKRAMLANLPESVRAQVTASKLPARNTLDYTTADGVRRVRLHDTDIVEIHPDGRVVIETGGWNTLTTRGRINAYAPEHVRVWSNKGLPVVGAKPAGDAFTWYGDASAAAFKPFARRAEVLPNGDIIPDATPQELGAVPALINRYIDAFKAGFPFNSSGDPWMAPGQVVSSETVLGWLGAGTGRPYLFDSILYHASVYAGTSPEGAAGYMRDLMTGRAKLDNFHTGRIRRYLKRAFAD